MFQPSAFLYLEDYRVRLEVLVPLREVGVVYPVAASDDATWDSERQSRFGPPIAGVIESSVSLSINGQTVSPEATNVVFLDVRAPMASADGKAVAVPTEWGAAGVMFHYTPRAGVVSEVEASFTGFSGGLTQLPVRVLSRTEESARLLTPRQNRLLVLHRSTDGKAREGKPVASAGRDLSRRADAEAVMQAILQGVYDAFEYGRDEDVYDALARSVSGDLLQRVYLDVRRTLAMEQEGGASATVRAIRVREVEIINHQPGKSILRVTWQVEGSLEHWGHVHARTNEYEGRVTLREEEGVFRMTDLVIERHERVGDVFSEREARP
jgi:hypothetical protein